MKRSEINAAVREASRAFAEHDWYLPPGPKWDVTDFGLGNFASFGLVLVNLAEEAEYCEKIMYMRRNQVTPTHCHRSKKEDIICRWGRLAIQVQAEASALELAVNGERRPVATDAPLILQAGERITLTQGVRHTFWADSDYAIVGKYPRPMTTRRTTLSTTRTSLRSSRSSAAGNRLSNLFKRRIHARRQRILHRV